MEHDYDAALTLFDELGIPVETVLHLFPQLEGSLPSASLSDEDRAAFAALCRFLTARRVTFLANAAQSSVDEAQVVDEALVSLFMLTDPAMATQLLRSRNSCHPAFVEAIMTPQRVGIHRSVLFSFASLLTSSGLSRGFRTLWITSMANRSTARHLNICKSEIANRCRQLKHGTYYLFCSVTCTSLTNRRK